MALYEDMAALVAATQAGLPDAKFVALQEVVRTVAASGAAQTIPAATTATIHRITLTAPCTFTFPAAGAGKSFTLVLVQDATGSRVATWPAGTKWEYGTAPVLSTTAAAVDYISFVCADGVSWVGFMSGKDVR